MSGEERTLQVQAPGAQEQFVQVHPELPQPPMLIVGVVLLVIWEL